MREDREKALEAKQKREEDRKAKLEEEENSFNEAHKDEIEAYNKYVAE